MSDRNKKVDVLLGGNIYINLYLKDSISPVLFTISDRSKKVNILLVIQPYSFLSLISPTSPIRH
jgi:hypothetical protein